LFFTGIFGQTALALIISSVFFNLQDTTAALYSKGALLFFSILMAAFQSALEVSLSCRCSIWETTNVQLDFDTLCSARHR
jgi:hypothetical protein